VEEQRKQIEESSMPTKRAAMQLPKHEMESHPGICAEKSRMHVSISTLRRVYLPSTANVMTGTNSR